jgi:hypothetical protein
MVFLRSLQAYFIFLVIHYHLHRRGILLWTIRRINTSLKSFLKLERGPKLLLKHHSAVWYLAVSVSWRRFLGLAFLLLLDVCPCVCVCDYYDVPIQEHWYKIFGLIKIRVESDFETARRVLRFRVQKLTATHRRLMQLYWKIGVAQPTRIRVASLCLLICTLYALLGNLGSLD